MRVCPGGDGGVSGTPWSRQHGALGQTPCSRYSITGMNCKRDTQEGNSHKLTQITCY